MKNSKLSVLLIVLALATLVFAGWKAFEVQASLSEGLIVPGKIISLETRQTRINKDVVSVRYHPVFVYKTPEDRSYTVVGSTGTSNLNQFRNNSLVKVWYKEGEEKQAKLYRFEEAWIWPLASAVAALILLALAVACYPSRTTSDA